jgi:uncharacterized protein YjbJ (UPF0337 family)
VVPIERLHRPRLDNYPQSFCNRHNIKGVHMSIAKKLANKAQAVNGATKKFIGRATGNTRLRIEGRVEQAKGNTKQAGAKAKDVFKH